MLNTQLLEEEIKRSGYCIWYICNTLDISRTAFDHKRKGKTPFRDFEIKKLAELLNLTASQVCRIFFNLEVGK